MIPTIGVLGGMGPLATVDFLAKLVLNTQAAHDANHIPFIAASLPQIPDRLDALLRDGPSPAPAMSAGIARLKTAGATLIAIPCNTAHAWYDELAAAAELPILHIVQTAIDALIGRGLAHGPIGVLATVGTIHARIYQDRLAAAGLQCFLPHDQLPTNAGILAVKTGQLEHAHALLAAETRRLLDAGCSAVILGCTEISVALGDVSEFASTTIDPNAALARAALEACGATLVDALDYAAATSKPKALV